MQTEAARALRALVRAAELECATADGRVERQAFALLRRWAAAAAAWAEAEDAAAALQPREGAADA